MASPEKSELDQDWLVTYIFRDYWNFGVRKAWTREDVSYSGG